MDPKQKKDLVSRSKTMEPVIRIGKSGLTESAVDEIKKQLKKKKLIKVKFLRSALEGKDKKELFRKLAEESDSEILHKVGFVVVLYKR